MLTPSVAEYSSLISVLISNPAYITSNAWVLHDRCYHSDPNERLDSFIATGCLPFSPSSIGANYSGLYHDETHRPLLLPVLVMVLCNS